MNRSTSALLAVTALPALLALTSVADTLAFQPKPGATLSRTVTAKSQMTLDDMSMTMNGNPMPMPMEIEMEMNMEQTVKVNDQFVEVGTGRPQKLGRTFENLEQQSSFSVRGIPGGDQETEVKGKSALEGKTVHFVWDEEAGAFKPRFPEDQGDPALLEGLEEDMDVRALLPKGPVSTGDTWTIPASDLKSLLMPGGNLKIEPTEQPEGMNGMDSMSDVSGMIGDLLEGEAKADFQGTRDLDGVKVGVIHVTLKVSSAKDISEEVADQMSGLPEGAEVEIDHMDVDLRMEGEGNLYWDISTGLPHSYELSGTIKVQMDMAMKMTMSGTAMNMGQVFQMSGTFNNGMTTR